MLPKHTPLPFCTTQVTYPFNSVSSIFWIIIPPWICISGAFPFSFQPVYAIAGSLALRIIEWLIVLKVKKESERNGTQLKEYSIFRSQQMNEVTVPLKLRAVCKVQHSPEFILLEP